jgi:hypothetical protein
MSVSEGSEVITITTDHGAARLPPTKKRKRHIAIDVETERGKQTGCILTDIFRFEERHK